MLTYAIVTPAHNEERHLVRTIASMRMQQTKPVRWVIVDDGSRDGTRELAERAASELDFVRVLPLRRGAGRDFGHKAAAFNAGVELLRGVEYDAIGNLDADVSFGPSYFSNLLGALERDPALGVTGGIIFTTVGGRFVTQDRTSDSVAGAVQLFRKECFEGVGGCYLPLVNGGEDAAAEIIAKSKGWKVEKSFADRVDEHRQTGTATARPVVACFRLGRRFHSLGYAPWFFAARCLYRVRDEPILLGSLAQWCGFVAASLRRQKVQLPGDVVRHLRYTQRRKLARLVAYGGRKPRCAE